MQKQLLVDKFLNLALIVAVPIFIIKALPLIGLLILNKVLLRGCGTIIGILESFSGFMTTIIFY
jgi:hypothetical protein